MQILDDYFRLSFILIEVGRQDINLEATLCYFRSGGGGNNWDIDKGATTLDY